MIPENRALPHPRRMPSSRSDPAVARIATTAATMTRNSVSGIDVATTLTILLDTEVRRRRTSGDRPRRVTSSTSSSRGWKSSAVSTSKMSAAVASPSKSKRYVTQPPSKTYERVLFISGGSCSARSKRRIPT